MIDNIGNSMVLQAIANIAKVNPDKTAIIDDHKINFTYKELWHEINCLAEIFYAEKYTCIAISSDNNSFWCIADLAAVLANIPVVPIPPFFSPEQIDHALSSAGAKVIKLASQ